LALLEHEYENFGRVGSLKKINKLLLPYSHYTSKKKGKDKGKI
jgi:hypothetical protein